jgi:hypothetical protein
LLPLAEKFFEHEFDGDFELTEPAFALPLESEGCNGSALNEVSGLRR